MPTLQILGTAGYHSNPSRQTVCAFIPEYGIVLDAGTSLTRLCGKIKTPIIDIFLSHLHLDHSVGLTYLLNVLWGTKTRACVRGSANHLKALNGKLFDSELFPLRLGGKEMPHGATAMYPDIHYTIVNSFCPDRYDVWLRALPHPGGSIGYRFRFSDGQALAYITDTTCSADPSVGYLDFIRGADLLVHECNFPDTIPGRPAWSGRDLAERTGHSWTSGVADLAELAGVKKLILTHFNPLDESRDPTHQDSALKRFPNTVIAQDGLEIEF